MLPPTVSVPPLTVTIGEAFMVTAPVPRFNGLVPLKVKFPFQACGLLARVMPPTVLSIVPPLIVKVPELEPRALLLLMFSQPPLASVVPPL